MGVGTERGDGGLQLSWSLTERCNSGRNASVRGVRVEAGYDFNNERKVLRVS